jgi:hypothetical protein
MLSFHRWQSVALATLCSWGGLSGGFAQARELYNHDTRKAGTDPATGAAIQLTDSHQQCNDDVFNGTILLETLQPQRRKTAELENAASERIYNCIRSYGNAATAAMMVIPISRDNPQACKVFLYSLLPGKSEDTRTISRRTFDCTSSRSKNNPYGADPLGVYNIDAIFPAKGAPVPEMVRAELGDAVPRIDPIFAPAFIEFYRDSKGAGRGLHGLEDINRLGGSIGCIRMISTQVKALLDQFDALDKAWRVDNDMLPLGWWRNTPIFFVDHKIIEKLPSNPKTSSATSIHPLSQEAVTQHLANITPDYYQHLSLLTTRNGRDHS